MLSAIAKKYALLRSELGHLLVARVKIRPVCTSKHLKGKIVSFGLEQVL
jgi:hypothetical protein